MRQVTACVIRDVPRRGRAPRASRRRRATVDSGRPGCLCAAGPGRRALQFPDRPTDQPTIQSADRWTPRASARRGAAREDRQPHKDHRLSDRSIGRSVGLPPPPPVPGRRRHDRAGRAGRRPTRPVNAEPPPPPHGCTHAAVCKPPLPPVLSRLLDRPLPMTYRPPAATATAALATDASRLRLPQTSNGKIYIENPHRKPN